MHYPLPARPSFLPGAPAAGSTSAFPLPPTNLVLSSEFPDPSSSTEIDTEACAICSSAEPKYTCPRCDRQTCSLDCSRAHKDKFSCSGERDPTKFVDLKTYGQGTWADDYRYLEEGRRKVAGWGEGLEKDLAALSTGGPNGSRGGAGFGGRGGGRGGMGGRGGIMGHSADRGQKRSKTDILRSQLLRRGCWVEFMPEGMERRKINQSSWNPRSQALHMTVQFSISQSVLDPASSTSAPPKIVTHHRVLLDHPTAELPSLSTLLDQPPGPSAPVPDKSEASSSQSAKKSASAVFLIPFYPSPARPLPEEITSLTPRPRPYFPPLDGSKPIAEVLKGTAFIEFPTIQVLSKEAYEADLQAGKIALVPLAEPRRKERPEVNASRSGESPKGKQPLVQVIGGDEVPRKTTPNRAADQALGALGAYASDQDEDDDLVDGDDDDVDMEDSTTQQDQDDHEGDEADGLDIAQVIQLEGGPEMLAKVGAALALDFGVPDEDEDDEEEDIGSIREASTK